MLASGLSALIVVTVALAMIFFAAFIVVKWRNAPHNDGDVNVKNYIISSIAGINGLLLAFLVVMVWQKYSTLREVVAAEAGNVINISRDAQLLPPADKDRILGLLDNYVKEVIGDDWPKLRQAGHFDIPNLLTASGTLSTLWGVVGRLGPSTINSNMIGNLDNLSKERVHRFAIARIGVPISLWVALGAGTLATILFSMFGHKEALHIKNVLMQIWFAIFLMAMLWVLHDMDFPFDGSQRIEPTAFEHAERVIAAMRAKA